MTKEHVSSCAGLYVLAAVVALFGCGDDTTGGSGSGSGGTGSETTGSGTTGSGTTGDTTGGDDPIACELDACEGPCPAHAIRCDGAYPNRWFCNDAGTWSNRGCVNDDECRPTGEGEGVMSEYKCVNVIDEAGEEVSRCVLPCPQNGSCGSLLAGTECDGAAPWRFDTTEVIEYCVPGTGTQSPPPPPPPVG